MAKDEWIKKEHMCFTELKDTTKLAPETKASIISKLPRWHWRKGRFSIVYPIGYNNDQYELYDGRECYRFDTLNEAKIYAASIVAK